MARRSAAGHTLSFAAGSPSLPAAAPGLWPIGGVHDRPFPVAGIVSGPFGIFRGDTNGPDRGFTQPRFSLVLLACGRFLSTSARRIDCQVLAEELAPLEVAWTATDPHAVTGPGIETARWLLQCCQRGYEL
jgi:hypothetical protein